MAASRKHGFTAGPARGRVRIPEYEAWCDMRRRCSNPKRKDYPHYGGRGIRVCERWQRFENFFADMGWRPSPQHSLDRIDVDGNYEPGNCRWATRSEQMKNRRDGALRGLWHQRRVA